VNLILFAPAETTTPLPRTDPRALHILRVLRRQRGETFDCGLINGPRGKATVTALDAQTREAMQEELMEITLKAKKTVLFITHQIDEAVYLSDRVIVFSARPGRVKADVRIAIERPRKLRLKRDPRFHALEDEVWSRVHDQASPALT
jgi:hypothetical protein